MEEAQPRANSQASSRLRRHPPGQGVGAAGSQKGEREPVVRCVAGGQGAQEGWLGIRRYPAGGWVQARMGPECSLGLLLQTAGRPEEPAGCAMALGKTAD